MLLFVMPYYGVIKTATPVEQYRRQWTEEKHFTQMYKYDKN